MYKFSFTLAAALFFSVAASAGILWDNYLSANPNNGEGYDGVYALSSERNTFVTNSWTGDDAIFDQTVTLEAISWYGLLQNYAGAEYTAVDVVIYTANPDPTVYPIAPDASPVVSFTDLSFNQRNVTDPYYEQLGYQVYEGTVDLPQDVVLPPDHYYYAVRVVGSTYGRAFAATTGDGSINPAPGTTMGVFQSTQLYYLKRPNWVYVNEASPRVSDYAYRLYGIVPEPASVALLVLAAAALRRR
jgi:hypothetical protein